MTDDLKNWGELAVRLRQYAKAVGTLGGLNSLDKALLAAADGVEAFGRLSERHQQECLEAHPQEDDALGDYDAFT